MANLRTKEELQDKEFNYFLHFKIELNEKNVKKIEKAIAEGQNKFQNEGVRGVRYRELIPDIQQIMLNDAVYNEATGQYEPNKGGRQREADNGRKLCLASATVVVTELCKRGMVFKSELEKIARDDGITLQELEGAFSKLFAGGIKYIDDSQKKFPLKTFTEIDGWLKTADKGSTIYELLEVAPNASYADIKAAHARLNSNNKGKQSVTTAVTNILGKVDGIFKSDETRAAYDAYVALRSSVFEKITSLRMYAISQITIEQYLEYVNNIQKIIKCPLERAEEMLAAALNATPLIRVAGMADGASNLETCPYPDCGKPFIRTANLRACPNCGRPLEAICWNCQSPVPFSQKPVPCKTCGATVQMKALYEQRVREMDTLIRSTDADISKLQSALTNLKNVLPGYEKMSSSTMAKKVLAYAGEITSREKLEETTGKEYKKEFEAVNVKLAEKNFLQAKSLLLQLKRKYPVYNAQATAAALAKADAEIAKSQTFAETAKKYIAAHNDAQAVISAAKALEICSDNLDAQQILRALPPEQPANLRVSDGGGKARLEWAASRSGNLTTFTVIRKVGAKPTGITDGTVLVKELSVNFYEDTNMVSATDYYYGVYAERCSVASSLSAYPSPIKVLLDVQHPLQETVADKIVIKWETASNVAEVEVWKKPGTVPVARGEGVRITSATKTGFTDDSPSPEGNSYFIVCAYNVGGKKLYSKGAYYNFKPYRIPKVIENISVSMDDTGRFVLSSGEVHGGTLQVYVAENKLPLPPGKVQPREIFNTLTGKIKKLDTVDEGGKGVSFALPRDALLWLYVINVNDQLLIASEPVLVTTITGITGLNYTLAGGVLSIKGKFSPDLKEVVAKISENAYASKLTDEGDNYTYSAEKIATDNGIVIKLKANSVSYVTLFAKTRRENSIAMCAPIRLPDVIDNREKQAILFMLDYTPSPIKPFDLTIKFEADEAITLPDFLLMRGRPTPRTKSAGELVDKVNGIELKKGFMTHGKFVGKAKVKVPPLPKGMGLALFPADDRAKVQFRETSKL